MNKIGFKNSEYIKVPEKTTNFVAKNSEKVQTAKRTVASFLPAIPIIFAQNLFTNTAIDKMFSVAKKITKDEVNILNEVADKVLKKANLSNVLKIQNITSKTNISKFSQSNLSTQMLRQVQMGVNAFFATPNVIYANREISPNLLFHEIGHAHNFKFSKPLKKMLCFYRSSQIAPFVIAFSSLLLNEEKPKEGAELTKFQKAKNIFRKTLPFVAAASSLPMVLEEGMATAKANRWLKEFCEVKLAKKVSRGYKFAFLTYLAIPVSAFLISFLGMKYKDFLAKENANSSSEKQNNTALNAQPKASAAGTHLQKA